MTPAGLDTGAAVVLAWLLTYVVHSTILLAVAAIAAWRFADHHAWLDVIWKTAVIAPLVTASLQLPAALTLPAPLTLPAALKGPPYLSIAVPTTIAAPVEAERPQASRTEDRVTAPLQPISAPSEEVAAWPKLIFQRWPTVAVLGWLIIAMVSVLRYSFRLRSVYREFGCALPVTTDLLDTVNRLWLNANQRRSIRLTTSSRCPVPFALGGRHIVVPERFLEELDPEQQRAALAHEVAHVARRDPEWRAALEIIERALFVQPLNRLARARLCDSAEFLCDEWAVQQTRSPLALARCLSVVASWWSPADELPAGVSAMARSDSAMVRRVTRILNDPPRMSGGPRVPWLLVPVTLVAVAAPRATATQVTAAQLPAAATVAAVIATATAETPGPQRPAERDWTPAQIAAARAQLRDYRSAGGSLEQRWRQAVADAGKQGLTDFWIVYTFTTPIHDGDVMLSDTRDGSFISSNGRVATDGPPLRALLHPAAVPLEGGSVAVLAHYRGARPDGIDRAGYRSVELGFDFGRTPVLWLGDAPESDSFAQVQNLFGQVRTEEIQVFLIELASLHSNANEVVPFLSRLVEPSRPEVIRREAAEAFEHQHDPRSVEILLRVARTDASSEVRTEAAETIGEVHTPQSIPALNNLIEESDDPAVRREAAEAFGEQPAEQALPAIQRALASNTHEDVLTELIEALGDIEDAHVLDLLVETANRHPNRRAQKEAVETLGDIDEPGVGDALARIASEHEDPDIQAEAIETLADVSAEAIPAQILALAESGRSARVRRQAIEEIADALEEISDAQALDTAEQALERVIFNDPDPGVRMEALDALDELPIERAERALRKVLDGHPDARVRREAAEHLRK